MGKKKKMVHPYTILRENLKYEKYFTFRKGACKIGLDHFFVPSKIQDKVKYLKISKTNFGGSGHKTVELTLTNIFENPMGKKNIMKFVKKHGKIQNSRLLLNRK